MTDDARTAIAAKLDRLAAKLGGMEPVRPLDLKIAIEAGRDALAIIGSMQAEQECYEESVVGALNERNTRDCRRADKAEAQVAAVRLLHEGHPDYGCIYCLQASGSRTDWPCPTIQALEQP